MCGTFGFELDFNTITLLEKNVYKEQICLFKKVANIIRNGDLFRLWNPFKVFF
jgi:alpha-galactosidase